MPTTYAVPNGRTVMGAFTYTGNGAASSNTTQNIATPFYPDLTWVKARSDGSYYHRLTSTGLTLPNYLSTNSTDAQGTLNDQISALASTYFQVKASGGGGTNQSGTTYVGWAWNANSGTTVSNTAGSITSTVSANTASGFSVVTYSITSASSTISTFGHGLGVAPSMVILKVLNAVDDWTVYHNAVPTPNSNWLTLNSTAAAGGSTSTFSQSSTTFGVRETRLVGSGGSGNIVAYCFAEVAGYSKFGSYTGNGSTDGTFVYLGFRPKFIMFKRTDSANVWSILDTSRDPYNVANLSIQPNNTIAEETGKNVDFLSNGFKQRQTDPGWNASGGTYIYAAFAENPFKYANAR